VLPFTTVKIYLEELKAVYINNRLTPNRTLKFEPSFNGFELKRVCGLSNSGAFKNNCEKRQLASSRLSAGHNSLPLERFENNFNRGFFFLLVSVDQVQFWLKSDKMIA
jgi:hypothetical protein